MDSLQQQHFDSLYKTHLTNLRLQGKRPATVDAHKSSASHHLINIPINQPNDLHRRKILPPGTLDQLFFAQLM